MGKKGLMLDNVLFILHVAVAVYIADCFLIWIF